jgi:TatD DNase family protein
MYINAHDHLTAYKNTEEALQIITDEDIMTFACAMDLPDYLETRKIAASNSLIKIGFGIHPWRVEPQTSLENLEPYIEEADFIGEIGLDTHWDERTGIYPKQKEVFEFFIAMAKKHQKFANIHTKGAEKEILQILEKHQARGHIIHWYSGPLDLVPKFLALDAYFTISVDVGHSALTDQLIDQVPLERMLTETDGPESLEWVTGEYGMPDYIKEIVRYIARRKKLAPQAVKKQLLKNAQMLFEKAN